ncbi:MAG: YtxH domain-containing protein [Nitrospirota bacterium]|nr:YtxH domain-containing protein [Nitrospirota bacterium]
MMDERNVLVPMGFSLLAGILIGGVAGLLYAPQSGARSRRQLANLADDVRERAGEIAEDATTAIEKTVERGRRLANL